MRRNVWLGFGTAAVLSTIVACRAPGQTQEDIRQAAEVRDVVTIAGCLQADDAAQFVLVNARLAQEPDGVPVVNDTEPPVEIVGTPAVPGRLPPVLRGPRYTVAPPADINLQAHVGSEVQITGTVQPLHEADRPVGTTGLQAEGRDPAADADRGIEGHIAASEVRLVAQACM